ncbi:hypothetical protein [Chitinophaga sp. RAB17]|uniref:hypothetical protein n=1 Tax=Chitinophaga sp. RAB17 TaxID=3233049 RepID=UPI003F90C80D
MANHISGMPVWAILLFIGSFLFFIAFITGRVRQAALDAGMTPRKAVNIQIGIFSFYVAFLVYVSFFSLKGTFEVNSLPPKVTVWAGLPLAIFLFVFIGNTRLFKTLLHSIKLESLISLHIFRVAGVFFIILQSYHLLPATFAFFAGLGDIITAIVALPVARMVAKRSPGWEMAVYAWNIFGILDIIDLLTIAVMIGANGNLREMTVFPFSWFPAFAPATILFLHTAVFRKLYQLKTSTNNLAIS